MEEHRGMLIRKDRVPVLWTLIYVPGLVSGLTLNLAHVGTLSFCPFNLPDPLTRPFHARFSS
jgi:hypothetical protein